MNYANSHNATDFQEASGSLLTSQCSQEDASVELQLRADDKCDSDLEQNSTDLTMMNFAKLYFHACGANSSAFSPPPGHDK